MPQRQCVRRLETPEVQGGDSYVVVSMVTYGDSVERDAAVKAGTLNADEYFRERLAKYVLDWNWVDNDGEPLPKPRNNPDVFKLLAEEEMDLLANAIRGRTEAERKNSVPASVAPSGPAEATSLESGPS